MTIRAEIEAIVARQDATAAEKRAMIADIKAGHIHLADKPRTIEVTRGRNTYTATIAGAERVPGGVSIDLALARNGKAIPFNGPWVVINPPCMVEDEAGDVVIERRDPKTKEIVQKRYREDPAAAFRQMLRDLVMSLK